VSLTEMSLTLTGCRIRMATRGSACRELRATQGEEEVGSLERVCARFAPNFGPGAGHQGWGLCLGPQHRPESGGFAVSDAENPGT
jgi:hypothetical protein